MADRRSADAKKQTAEPLAQLGSVGHRIVASATHDSELLVDQVLFDELKSAALSKSPDACMLAAKKAVAEGTLPEDLADHYVPALARDMGTQWCEDQLSFAGVTIGVSRLQAVLRALGPNWSGDKVSSADAPSILLVVGQEVYHTLGAIVLSGQLRRKGFSVKLVLGGKPKDVADLICRTKYHSVFISSSCGETLESLRRIVDAVKNSITNPPLIVVGGTILEVETAENVMALTGANYATNVPDEALRFCGLNQMTTINAHIEDGT